MNIALVLVSLVAVSQDEVVVKRPDLFVTTVMAEGLEIESSTEKFEQWRLFSLRKNKSWSEGTVWFIEVKRNREFGPDQFECQKGKYEIVGSTDEANLLRLRVVFSKRFTREAREKLDNWQNDLAFEPFGATLEIPIGDNYSVPEEGVDLTITKKFFVDKDGKEIEKRNELEGVPDALKRRFPSARFFPMPETVIRTKFLGENDLLEHLGIDKKMPPGFVAREK